MGTENKITQYADDTELMLEGDRTSFEEAVYTVQRFGKKSRPKCKKTVPYGLEVSEILLSST